jgi:hypothetical protein
MLAGSGDLAVEMERQRQASPLMELAQILRRANLGEDWVSLGSWTGNGDMTGGLQVEYLNLPLPCTKKKSRIIICPITVHTITIL